MDWFRKVKMKKYFVQFAVLLFVAGCAMQAPEVSTHYDPIGNRTDLMSENLLDTPGFFDFVGQVATGTTPGSRREAADAACAMVRAGATHVILGMPAALGPSGLNDVARDCLRPIREVAA